MLEKTSVRHCICQETVKMFEIIICASLHLSRNCSNARNNNLCVVAYVRKRFKGSPTNYVYLFLHTRRRMVRDRESRFRVLAKRSWQSYYNASNQLWQKRQLSDPRFLPIIHITNVSFYICLNTRRLVVRQSRFRRSDQTTINQSLAMPVRKSSISQAQTHTSLTFHHCLAAMTLYTQWIVCSSHALYPTKLLVLGDEPHAIAWSQIS
jgi:hypothetical protein